MKVFFLHIILSSYLLLPSLISTEVDTSTLESDETYQINYQHPGNKENMDSVFVLHHKQNKDGLPYEYYMDVESVICLEDLCAVVPVRLYWNTIGKYKRYELSNGITLEKGDKEPFEEEDYLLLDKILKDANSPFETLDIEEIISSIPEHGEDADVDAYSGATTLMINDTASVKGAALTCFTLWHWANGEIQSSIKDITGSKLNTSQLLSYLQHSNAEYRLFAIEQFSKQKHFDKAVVNQLLENSKQAKREEVNAIIGYFEAAPESLYYYGIENLILQDQKNQRSLALSSLLKFKSEPIPTELYQKIAINLSSFNSYREVNLFLTLMENKGILDPYIIEQTLALLNKDILIARRAYWFLEEKELSQTQQKKIKSFKRQNQDYL